MREEIQHSPPYIVVGWPSRQPTAHLETTAMYTSTTPRGTVRHHDTEAEAIAAAQKTADSTRKEVPICWRSQLVRLVRPTPRKHAASTRIDARIDKLIASGLTVEQAIATISAENTARLFAR